MKWPEYVQSYNQTTESEQKEGQKLSTAAIIAIVIVCGFGSAVLLSILIVYCLMQKRRRIRPISQINLTNISDEIGEHLSKKSEPMPVMRQDIFLGSTQVRKLPSVAEHPDSASETGDEIDHDENSENGSGKWATPSPRKF